MSWLKQLRIDKFLLILLSVVTLATLFPCQDKTALLFQYVTQAAIALLFFMHGAKLSRSAILSGLGHWRLHLLVLFSTFILFPLLGLALQPAVPKYIPSDLYAGMLYLCAMPATVQSAIAFTSIAKGNVAAAVCSASASSILGVFLSPILVGLLLHSQYDQQDILHAIGAIVLQLMVPFILGHLSRVWIAEWVERHKRWINMTDRSSILLVVYTAFSAAVVEGIWQHVSVWSLSLIVILSLLLLSLVILFNTSLSRLLGFSLPDEVTIVFCGSKKSLANGIPMANVLFPVASVGMMVLPLMIFHQLQLMICAVLAQRYAKKIEALQNEHKVPIA